MRGDHKFHEQQYKLVLYNQDHLSCGQQASWMSDAQWEQVRSYVSGRAVPTDPTIVRAFIEGDQPGTWGYRNPPGSLVGRANYESWCNLIRRHFDPDLAMDVGL